MIWDHRTSSYFAPHGLTPFAKQVLLMCCIACWSGVDPEDPLGCRFVGVGEGLWWQCWCWLDDEFAWLVSDVSAFGVCEVTERAFLDGE